MKSLLIVAATLLAGHASAATIYTQTAPVVGGYAADEDGTWFGGPSLIADHFNLTSNESIASLTWRGFYNEFALVPANAIPSEPDSFTVRIFENFTNTIQTETGSVSFDTPAFDVLFTFTLGGNVNRSFAETTSFNGVDYSVYEYAANLDTGINLDAGKYWVSIQNNTLHAPDYTWFWGSIDTDAGNVRRDTDARPDLYGWNQQIRNTQYFSLSNSSVVPLPAAVWLFGSALTFLGFAARRNQVAL